MSLSTAILFPAQTVTSRFLAATKNRDVVGRRVPVRGPPLRHRLRPPARRSLQPHGLPPPKPNRTKPNQTKPNRARLPHSPRSLDKLTLHRELGQHLKQLVASGDCPHFLFYGPPGAGKTTLVMALLRELFGPSVEKLKARSFSA